MVRKHAHYCKECGAPITCANKTGLCRRHSAIRNLMAFHHKTLPIREVFSQILEVKRCMKCRRKLPEDSTAQRCPYCGGSLQTIYHPVERERRAV